MKFIFLAPVRQSFRYYSPIILNLIKHNFEFHVWIDTDDYRAIEKSCIKDPFFEKISDRVSFFSFDSELEEKILANEGRYFVSLNPPEFELSQKLRNAIDKHWIIIQHGYDTFLEFLKWEVRNKAKLENNYTRYFMTYTDFFYNKNYKWLRNACPLKSSSAYKYLSSVKTIKVPMGFPICTGTTSKCMRNYEKKRSLLYLPFPYSEDRVNDCFVENPSYAWEFMFSGRYMRTKYNFHLSSKTTLKRIVSEFYFFLRGWWTSIYRYEAWELFFKGLNEKKVIFELRKFCDKNNLELVIKGRRKFNINKYAYEVADEIIDDNELSQCPTKLQEAVKNADIVVGYNSTAIFEIASMKKLYININLPLVFFNNDRLSFDLFDTFSQDSMYNHKTITRAFTIEHFINYFSTKKLSELRVKHQDIVSFKKRYLNQFNNSPEEKFVEFFSSVEKKSKS